MIDGIKATYIDRASHTLALPCWEVTVNEQTGQRVNDNRAACVRGLHLNLKPLATGGHVFNINGSLHKFHNFGEHNAGAYTMPELQNTISGLANVLGIDPASVALHGLEIGVNVPLPYSPQTVIKNLVSYKGCRFIANGRNSNHKGVICELAQYSLKVYDKGKQAEKAGNILRIEIAISKMQKLISYGITSLADLQNPNKVFPLVSLLLDAWEQTMVTNTKANLSGMSDRDLKTWLYLTNPVSWENMGNEKAKHYRKRWASLLSRYCINTVKKDIFDLIKNTWQSLFPADCEAENTPQIYRHMQQAKRFADPPNLPLECTVKTGGNASNDKHLFFADPNTIKTPAFIRPNNINSAKITHIYRAKVTPPLLRTCASCGRDISNQRKQAIYCSERLHGRAGKSCRNKGSNRRRALKNQLKRAMNQNQLIAVTYRPDPESGHTYTDTLCPSEIMITCDWLNRVERIDILPEGNHQPPEPLRGQAARDYLRQTTNKHFSNP